MSDWACFSFGGSRRRGRGGGQRKKKRREKRAARPLCFKPLLLLLRLLLWQAVSFLALSLSSLLLSVPSTQLEGFDVPEPARKREAAPTRARRGEREAPSLTTSASANVVESKAGKWETVLFV